MKNKNYTKLSKYDLEKGIYAEFRWSISRGRDTYGYNICSLYVNGDKVSSCNGGGYDMKGTALGQWIEMQFPEELKTLEAHVSRDSNEEWKPKTGHYGLFFHVAGKPYGKQAHWVEGARVSLDGACGIREMEGILKALGYDMRYIPTRSKHDSLYLIEPVKVETPA